MSDVRVDPVRARAMRKLLWVDPETVLAKFRRVELQIPPRTDPQVRHLRTNSLKHWREARQALLLAHGLSQKVLNRRVWVAKSEEMDYDCIIRWQTEDRDNYYPVQLKELPPDDLNAEVSLEDIYDKLEKYRGTADLSVAIHINRRMQLSYAPWSRPRKPLIRELWLFGCTSPDQNQWFLYGSVLHDRPQYHEFTYPALEANDV